MKKWFSLLTACFMLSGCNQSSNKSPSNIEKLKEHELCDLQTLEVAVNEMYNVYMMLFEEFKSVPLRIEVKDDQIISLDEDLGLVIGKQIGETKLTIKTPTYYQNISVFVKDELYMKKNLTLDKGRLFNKNAVFYGDSITDTSRRPGFTDYVGIDYYPEIIAKDAQMKKTSNFAYSGATAAYCQSVLNDNPNTILGVDQVIQSSEELVNADYAFILMGTNDFMRCVPLGSIDDHPTNPNDATTFMGAYNLMLETIIASNPNIRVIGILIPYATWPQDSGYEYASGYGKTRDEYNSKINEVIINQFGFKTIQTMDLWNATNALQYIPDGIHPAKLGHETIAKRILNQL